MGRSSEEIYVDNKRYLVTHYSGSKSLKLLHRLAKIVGEPIGLMSAQGLDSSVGPELIGQAIRSLTQSCTPEEFEKLARDVLEGCQVYDDESMNMRMINFDLDFSGNIGHLFKLLKEVLTFQYSDFLGGIAAVMPEPAVKKKAIKAL